MLEFLVSMIFESLKILLKSIKYSNAFSLYSSAMEQITPVSVKDVTFSTVVVVTIPTINKNTEIILATTIIKTEKFSLLYLSLHNHTELPTRSSKRIPSVTNVKYIQG